MKALSNMTALIIEPHAGMRGSLHNMLNLCEITKIDHAVSSGTAIRPLQNKNYDIILCEYDLVDGQDGQQLLEDLRHNKIIPLWTVFIMVTAERTYQKVVSAAELAPTDYLLKPFTADALQERIRRALEKLGVGRLPGDIRFTLFGKTVFLPFASTVLLSGVVFLIARLL